MPSNLVTKLALVAVSTWKRPRHSDKLVASAFWMVIWTKIIIKSFSFRKKSPSIVEPGSDMRGAVTSVRRENTQKVGKNSRPKADDSDMLLVFYHSPSTNYIMLCYVASEKCKFIRSHLWFSNFFFSFRRDTNFSCVENQRRLRSTIKHESYQRFGVPWTHYSTFSIVDSYHLRTNDFV